VLRDPLQVQIPQVLSLCYAIPTSLLLYHNSGLVCFLLILLPATEKGGGRKEKRGEATQEAEIGRIAIQGQSRQKVSEIPFQPIKAQCGQESVTLAILPGEV
jgi:hypothetical protein